LAAGRNGVVAATCFNISGSGSPTLTPPIAYPGKSSAASDSAASAGYQLSSIDAFDLFPNTAHIEAVVTFLEGTACTSHGLTLYILCGTAQPMRSSAVVN
jgi:hypothetical protein